MDETEVQVEIACWAQEHPEASTSNNWENGNEPWVSFAGKLCTLHVGLGGLTWKIQVPSGYQTRVDPGDGKRKRLWDPLDYQDTVIIQSRSTPFHVSVVDHSNVVLDSSFGVEREFAQKVSLVGHRGSGVRIDYGEDGPQNYMFVQGHDQNADDTNPFILALRRAETLADVLDAIYGLAKLYKVQRSTVVSGKDGSDPQVELQDMHTTYDELSEDEGDDLFATEEAIKWNWIADQVNFAQEACAYEARAAMHSREFSEFEKDFSTVEVRQRGGRELISLPTTSGSSEFGTEEYTLVSPTPLPEQDTTMEQDTTIVLDTPSPWTAGPVLNASRTLSDSDGEISDGSWDMGNLSDHDDANYVDSSYNDLMEEKDKSPQTLTLPLDSEHKHRFQQLNASHPQILSITSFKDPTTETPFARPELLTTDHLTCAAERKKELKSCTISFNPVSFSVECTLFLSRFMDNHNAAAALGFALEHPLRVEIVPNKAEVDALSWTGAVEVYVSQQTDWHNHVSEEICGLLCLVPHIVQTYFHDRVPRLIRHRFTKQPRGDLFIDLLETLVRRLEKLNAGNSCCVCANPGERPSYHYMRERSMWPCSDNLCQAMYHTWEEVSSMDIQERQREENSGLHLVEEGLRDEFAYDERESLRAALGAYGVNTDNMHYGQMIRALARIELWNQKDPSTLPSQTLFRRPDFPT